MILETWEYEGDDSKIVLKKRDYKILVRNDQELRDRVGEMGNVENWVDSWNRGQMSATDLVKRLIEAADKESRPDVRQEYYFEGLLREAASECKWLREQLEHIEKVR